MATKKHPCRPNFDFLRAKYGKLSEMDFFSLLILCLGVDKYHVMGNKRWGTLGDALRLHKL
jgi:hypothetical protein